MDAPLNKLTNTELMWAASNLPDNKRKGEFDQKNINFNKELNHKSENTYEVFGISEDDLKTYGETMANCVKKTIEHKGTKSEAIQEVLEILGNDSKFITSMVIKVISDAHEHAVGATRMISGTGGIKDLLELLKNLNKMKDKDDESDD